MSALRVYLDSTFRPLPGSVQDTKYIYHFAFNSIDRNIGCFSNNKLSSTHYTATPPQFWVIDESVGFLDNYAQYPSGCSGAIFCDVIPNLHKILTRLARKLNAIQGLLSSAPCHPEPLPRESRYPDRCPLLQSLF